MTDPVVVSDAPGMLTAASNLYMTSFVSYSTMFMGWGKEIFKALLTINVTWLAIWYAFDRDSLMSGMSDFLKRFMIAMIFYSLMTNPDLLASIINTTVDMGNKLVGSQIDPSSVIGEGFELGNKVLEQVNSSSFLTNFMGALEALVVYVIIVFCFMTIGLQIAVAQIVSTALAVFACLSLSFSALGATSSIATKTIDALIGNCFKLLGYYIIVGATKTLFDNIVKQFPTGFKDMTPYGWICASTLLMWLLAKNLPDILERIGGGIVGETKGASAAAIAMTAVNLAKGGMKAGQEVIDSAVKGKAIGKWVGGQLKKL